MDCWRRGKKATRDWSSLPPELLLKISERVLVTADYVRFRAVCKTWRSASPKNPTHLPCQKPWLMLPCKDNDTAYSGDFFSLADDKLHHPDFPQVGGQRCLGSSLGWLCFVSETNLDVSLINPLTKDQIQLPPVTTLPELTHIGNGLYVSNTPPRGKETLTALGVSSFFLKKLILSETPTSHKCVAMLIYGHGHKMAFCRPGTDSNWAIVIDDYSSYHEYKDVIFHKGRSYSVLGNGTLMVCNPHAYDPQEKAIAWCTDLPYNSRDLRYLVELSGELYKVLRCYPPLDIYSREPPRTTSFQIFKFLHVPSCKKWMRVTNLGQHTLFLGMNSSFSILGAKGFKPNCIYFTDHYERGGPKSKFGGYDMGIFNLDDGSIEPLPSSVLKSQSLWIWPLLVWITPSLC